MTNDKELWKAILAELPAGSIIAGGCLRDYLIGVPPKDIDVFVPGFAVDWRNGRNNALPGFELQFENIEEYEGVDNVTDIWRREMFGFEVQAICYDVPRNEWSGDALVKTFDFGLTRVWWDNENEFLVPTSEAHEDYVNHRVTCLLTDKLERAYRRFERFNERHGGDWAFVAPPLPEPLEVPGGFESLL